MIDDSILIAAVRASRHRFEKCIDLEPETGCHAWTGCLTARDGYGWFTPLRDHRIPAQRAAWILAHGEVPKGNLRNECGQKHCVNVAHWALQKGRSKCFTEAEREVLRAEYVPYITTLKELAQRHRVSMSAIWFALLRTV